jgi:hypothetical protein
MPKQCYYPIDTDMQASGDGPSRGEAQPFEGVALVQSQFIILEAL